MLPDLNPINLVLVFKLNNVTNWQPTLISCHLFHNVYAGLLSIGLLPIILEESQNTDTDIIPDLTPGLIPDHLTPVLTPDLTPVLTPYLTPVLTPDLMGRLTEAQSSRLPIGNVVP